MVKLKVSVHGNTYELDVEVEEETRPTLGTLNIGGSSSGTPSAPTTASLPAVSANAITAPLAGTVARVLVEEGQDIEAGAVVLVLEAMKMETEITAPAAGKVGTIFVAKGDAVQGGQALVEMT